MAAIKELSKLSVKNLKGKRVILRLDLNVPIAGGQVTDDYRIKKVLPTIEFLKKAGAKTIVISHLGRKGESLRPVAEYLNRYFNVGFIPTAPEKAANTVRKIGDGEVIMLDNLRKNAGEEKNSLSFAKNLASLGDIYANDAFSVSHRKHASVHALPGLLPCYVGPLFMEEIKNLSLVFRPKRPFILILGGAKFETKLPVLKRFIKIADKIYIVGAIAHSFYRVFGYQLGKSLIDKKISAKPFMGAVKKGKIIIPSDATVVNSSAAEVVAADKITKEEIIVDIGNNGLDDIKRGIKSARMILWNGPAGNFEEGFNKGTLSIARAIVKSKAHSIVGGGDTLAAIAKLSNNSKSFGFISTGGGAMLEFLARGTLPGIEALTK